MIENYLFAIDIDGTLLTSDHEITARTLRAIEQVRAAGHRVILATGRMASSTLPIARKLGIDIPVICLNGADIVDPTTGESVSVQPFIPDVLLRLEERLRGTGADYFLLGHRFAVSQTRQYGQYDTILTRSLKEYLADPFEPVLKLTIQCGSVDLQAKLFTELSQWQTFDMTRSIDGQIYATAFDITKLSAIGTVCQWWQIPLTHVTAFGNAENDLAMLQHVGVGIAMANSDECILKHISRRTRSNDQEGVAFELERFLAQPTV